MAILAGEQGAAVADPMTAAAVAAPTEQLAAAPVVDTPIVDAPVADAPVADAPVADAPVVDTPIVDAPVAGVVAEAENPWTGAASPVSTLPTEATPPPSIEMPPPPPPPAYEAPPPPPPPAYEPPPPAAGAPVAAVATGWGAVGGGAPHPEDEPTAPPEPDSPLGIVDPHGIGAHLARMPEASQRLGQVAAAVLSGLLADGEVVEGLVVGQYQANAAVAALTATRVLLVNDHQWRPDIRVMPIESALIVQGWMDEHTAALVFESGGWTRSIQLIATQDLARDFATALREKIAALGS
jgi:hypothetical protein